MFVQDVEVDVPNIPHAAKKGTHKVVLNPKELFIEAADFREVRISHPPPKHAHTHRIAGLCERLNIVSCHESLLNCIHIFLQNPESGYRRLTPQQSVGLRHAGFVIFVHEVIKVSLKMKCLSMTIAILFLMQDNTGKVTEVHVTAKKSDEIEKPKAFIHWVSYPLRCSINLYDRL